MKDAWHSGYIDNYLDEYAGDKALFEKRNRVFRNVVSRATMQRFVHRATKYSL